MRKHIPLHQGILKITLALLLVVAGYTASWAQNAINDIPEEINFNDATITNMGHATLTLTKSIVTDALTGRVDTTCSVTNIEWNTEKGTAKRRMAERGGDPQGSDFYDGDNSWWYDMYWFSYNYPSVNSEGVPLLLSSLACMPDDDCSYTNNVIIGCHITITSNKQCPTSYNYRGGLASDVGLMMMHSSSGAIHASESDQAHYNLVILHDYEVYGITRSHAHPYICEELTARQVVDAVRYGIALYNRSSATSSIRHPFRSGWRSICLGYSQGGAVALATQRFIEQNGLTDELHFSGSVCGDGPYDPTATLYFYAQQCSNGTPLSMPVVMPLILTGMCDFNPYMKNHDVSDYLSQNFLNSGILNWLVAKEKTTDEIEDAWLDYYASTPYVSGGKLNLHLNDVLTPAAYAYITNLYHSNSSCTNIPLPTHRGVMEDLHFALESNNLTKGWSPQHAILLYHSYDDNVVPESNRRSVGDAFGNWVIKLHASFGDLQFDHVTTGIQYFMGTSENKAVRALAGAPIHQTIQDAVNLRGNFSSSELD